MKRSIILIALGCALTFSFSPANAGPLKWLKEAGEYLFDTQAKRDAQRRAAERAAREAAEAQSRQVARSAMTQQMGRVATAFQVGAYTFTGVMVFDTVAAYGYAMSDTPHENEEVASEIANATAAGQSAYQEKYCMNPSSRARYVVPSWTVTCGDGSAPQAGPGIALAELRHQAAQ